MKASYVSSNAISQALRYSMMRMQTELVSAQKESTTLRVADVGLALGTRTGQSVSLARDVERLNGIIDSNSLISSRLSSTQDVLDQLTARAEEFRSTLSAAVSGSTQNSVVQADGRAMLELSSRSPTSRIPRHRTRSPSMRPSSPISASPRPTRQHRPSPRRRWTRS
jgi:flagellar hook-associated protein 3 FlgL